MVDYKLCQYNGMIDHPKLIEFARYRIARYVKNGHSVIINIDKSLLTWEQIAAILDGQPETKVSRPLPWPGKSCLH